MSEHWNELTGDRADLATALAPLVGTELDEQVFIACREDVGEQPDPLLDIAHMEEESGVGRYQVYVTLPPGTTLDDSTSRGRPARRSSTIPATTRPSNSAQRRRATRRAR